MKKILGTAIEKANIVQYMKRVKGVKLDTIVEWMNKHMDSDLTHSELVVMLKSLEIISPSKIPSVLNSNFVILFFPYNKTFQMLSIGDFKKNFSEL